jgi:hypothetical protein
MPTSVVGPLHTMSYGSGTQYSWVCFDFKDSSVGLRQYSFRSGKEIVCAGTLTVDGSNDGTKWTMLDSRRLEGNWKTKTFECSNHSEESPKTFRYIRIAQIVDLDRKPFSWEFGKGKSTNANTFGVAAKPSDSGNSLVIQKTDPISIPRSCAIELFGTVMVPGPWPGQSGRE